MAIFTFGDVFGYLKDDMAKARSQRKPQAINEDLVSSYVDRLIRAATDRPTFETVLADIKSDNRLTAIDTINIAHRYNQGGKKPSSKVTALASISKRFVEIVRFHAKNKVAEKARPW